MKQIVSAGGSGQVIVQISGDGNSVVVGYPHLMLTQHRGLLRRVASDPNTGKAREIDVIRPYTRSIDMVGRQRQMNILCKWVNTTPPVSVMVMTGDTGIGKTRLALELVEKMAQDGWRSGFLTRADLKRFIGQHNLADWGWNAPVLAVVDYASASTRVLHEWLKELSRNRLLEDDEAEGLPPLRLLLLERQANSETGWWSEVLGVGSEKGALEQIVDRESPIVLGRLADAAERRAVLTSTLERLGGSANMLAVTGDSGFDRRLERLTWGGVPLMLMMTAAAVAATGLRQVIAMGANKLAISVAEMELERIRKVVEGAGLAVELRPMVNHLTAVVILHQGLAANACEVIEEECRELHYVVPGGSADGAGGIATIEPDMIAEALLVSVWDRNNRNSHGATRSVAGRACGCVARRGRGYRYDRARHDRRGVARFRLG